MNSAQSEQCDCVRQITERSLVKCGVVESNTQKIDFDVIAI